MKDTEQSSPEVEMKAMQYVNVGYQRILTFECQSGGFNWWEGDNPGNAILSALAIMMLRDTAKVYDAVDTKVIDRAFNYLKKIQRGDGSWEQDTHLHAGNENLGQGSLRSTCYIAWALGEGGYAKTDAAKKAVAYIEKRLDGEKDLYTLGMCANALGAAGKKGGALSHALKTISEAAIVEGDQAHWEQKGKTLVNSGGIAGTVEVTALMALAFIKARSNLGLVPKVVNWLAASKDPNGTWGYNTQATVLALKTFILAATLDTGDTKAGVRVLLDDEELGKRSFDNFNRDVLWQVEVPAANLGPANNLVLEYEGRGNLGYQVVSTHFVPWDRDAETPKEPLTIDVSYDRTELRVNETVKVTATFTKNDPEATGMILATLGVPPGFDVMTEDLEGHKREKTIRTYELTGRQLILYLDDIPAGESATVDYRLKARYPVKAQTGESEVRMYYQGDIRSTEQPLMLEVN